MSSALRKYTVLIVCLICAQWVCAQRRFMTHERPEYLLEKLAGFSFKDEEGKTDLFWGLHASQYVGSHHLFGFSLEGSWSTYINNMPIASVHPGGGAVGVHFVYEYQYSGLLFQTGFGLNFQQVYNKVRDTTMYHYNMHDTWEYIEDAEFILRHKFYERVDMSRNVYAQLPLYFGNYLLGHYGVGYWLAGFHLNCAFWGETRQKLYGSTMALYEPFLGVWHEMDNHGYRRNVPIERKGERLKLKFDIMAHFEMGYEYSTYRGPHNYRSLPGDRIDCRLRFAGFIDFGMLNICPHTSKDLCTVPLETIYDFPTYRVDHVFSSRDAKAFWMRNLFVGFRFTLLVGLPFKEHCILCDPWEH